MKFTIIIPAYEEYQNLNTILPSIQGISDDIIIINAGKKDGTEELCFQYGARYIQQKSKGKGRALVEAVDFAKYDIVCFFDADLAHDPKDIKKLVAPIFQKDVLHVSGSRMLGGSSELFAEFDHIFRLIGSMIINYLISKKFNIKLTDCQNGFRAIDKAFFKTLNPSSKHTTIEQELVGKTLRTGHIILEVPTHEYRRIDGVSKISLMKHSFSYITSLLKILQYKKKKNFVEDFEKTRQKYPINWWEKN